MVTGVRFQSGTPGSKELCFTYKSYMARVIVKVSPGVPAQLKLLDEPEKVGRDFYWFTAYFQSLHYYVKIKANSTWRKKEVSIFLLDSRAN